MEQTIHPERQTVQQCLKGKEYYPSVTPDDVYKEVLEQTDNFKKYANYFWRENMNRSTINKTKSSKTMKKIFTLVLALSMVFSLCACGNDKVSTKETAQQTDMNLSSSEELSDKQDSNVESSLSDEQNDTPSAKENAVFFGSIEQDANAENGPEPIEWGILEEQNGNCLLISKYALKCIPYDDVANSDNCSWATCSVRAWLNNEFLNNSFSAEEKGHIVTQTLTTGSDTTEDMVSILSEEEMKQYFPGQEYNSPEEFGIWCYPTNEAISEGAYGALVNIWTQNDPKINNIEDLFDGVDHGVSATIWLRSNSNKDEYDAIATTGNGTFACVFLCHNATGCVRPVICVDAEIVH